ncbi:DUF3086 domain-containing protein [Aphanothece sacrum]|uniref:Uncharacterized protein n=1 Tax=Aphanothece sacrum FPU1 TaxID=1920663 RepID=A0A401IE44_APHSA|nr:DUF3086 domain-containing protein [Aphanothece sacrum]GBF79533.1 hypothetical protein AsFPU1_0929 [Aphanothece sacrum FPU1]GBF83926.1 hypothetical protein AsFPU3_0970 [Aphanothece sacrum FPU3]
MTSDDSKSPKLNLTTDIPEKLVDSPNLSDSLTMASEPTEIASTDSDKINIPVSEILMTIEEPQPEVKQPLETLISLSENSSSLKNEAQDLKVEIESLERQKRELNEEIKTLRSRKVQLLSEQTQEVEQTLRSLVQEGLKEFEQQKQALEIAVEQLERRRDKIRQEMRTTFAGVSQDLAIRVQGFKDYLVGSLQDLAAAAEQLEFPTTESWNEPLQTPSPVVSSSSTVQFTKQQFEDQTRKIERILEQYRKNPDYYGPPWQLRRTFEPVHAERVQKWFFSQGGRGTIRSLGNRLQNILITSAVMSVLYSLYGDRSRTLILANSPERLGEWRRGLQDCLGISRGDFGPEKGVVLFESPDALIQKAERLVDEQYQPFVVIDETEDQIDLSLLQFPLWLGFARDPKQMSSYLY